MPINPGNPYADYSSASYAAAWSAARKMFTPDQISAGQADDFINKYKSDSTALISDGYMSPAEYETVVQSSVGAANSYTDPTGAVIYTDKDTGQQTVTSPGITLDQSAYGQTDFQKAQLAHDYDRQREIEARDPNRFYTDRAAIDDVAAQEAQFQAPGEIATVKQGRNYFDPTGEALGAAQGALDTASSYTLANGGKSADQYDAGTLARLAAMGLTPSAAESMALQSGNEQQRAYAQQQLDAQSAVRRGANDINASQRSMAAGARGNLAGLARLQGANNTALGQAQLYQSSLDDTARRAIGSNAARAATDNQAAQIRAQEMAGARGQYVDYAAGVRGQNLQQASQLGAVAQQQAGLAGQQYGIDQTVLQNSQNNAAITNQGNQFAATGNYQAASDNAQRDLMAQQANQAQDWNVAQGNQQTAVQAQNLDDTAYGNTSGAITDAANVQQAANIKLEQDYMGAAQQNTALNNNFQTGNASLVQQADQFEKERGDKILGSAIGAGATVAAAAAAASDERVKNIKGHASPHDFSGAEDDVYSYKPEYRGKLPGADSLEHVGPMAQDLPDDVQYTVDGKRVVDIGRLALRLSSAVGQLQRQNKQARG